MKTRTMKKALSLILAVLMIALAIPFTLLPAAAEGENPTIVGATIGGCFPSNDKNRGMAFQSSNPGSNIYDGKIGTDAESEAYTSKANALKNAYFDADGKFAYIKDEAVAGGYYHVIFLELNEKSTVDKLHLWADSGRTSSWAGPNGYDIWYSADGVTYQKTNLSFSGIRNSTQVDPTIYVDDNFKGSACIAHHMDMGGVEAKYIAIAVTEFAYGSGSGQSIIYEATVDGTVIVDEDAPVSTDVKFNNVNIYAQNGSGTTVNFGSANKGDKALDKILHEDNYSSARNNKDELTKRTYFDENGKIAYKDGADFYGVIVAELSTLTKLDTFTIWSPNSTTGGWLDNAAYDIYYSVDGVSFAPVEGATFADAISAHKNVPVSEFPGTATSGNSTGGIYRNDVDMKGVTAKYIAIAVKDTIPDKSSNRRQIVLYELTAQGTAVAAGLEVGAAVRMDAPTGLRFTGTVSKNYVDGLKAQYGEDNVKLGMLITPTDYLTNNGLAFTKEALDACTAISGAKYLEIDAETVLTEGNNYKINCAIVEILEANYDRSFSAVLYIKVNGEIVEYSAFNEFFNSRSVAEVAEAAYYDLKSEADTTYTNEVVVDGVTMYSPYTEAQRSVLYGFFG